MTNLSPEQLAALEKIKTWHATAQGTGWNDAGILRLFGPAGTGKTTLAREVPAALGLTNVRYAAYTGKAANVLRGKGCAPVSTLHSLIYMPTFNAEVKAKLDKAREDLSAAQEMGDQPDLISQLEAEIIELEAQSKRISFEWNPDSELATAQLLILDEVSMVDAKLAADIERFDVPVLVLGDPEQLEPVGGEGYYTNAKPDILLTEIHRQALESPVLSLATRVRLSSGADLGLTDDDQEPRSLAAAMDHDQVLVWTNKRRWSVVKAIRTKLGFPDGTPVSGDRIMCLTNNKDLAVFNGQQFDVLGSTPGTLGPTVQVRDENGAERLIACYASGFAGQEAQDTGKQAGEGLRGLRMLATFAQAITVHKAQGSEWGSVYVYNETQGMISMYTRRQGRNAAVTSARRWLYTAATRAQDRVTIARP